jgi:hypothetical protein
MTHTRPVRRFGTFRTKLTQFSYAIFAMLKPDSNLATVSYSQAISCHIAFGTGSPVHSFNDTHTKFK